MDKGGFFFSLGKRKMEWKKRRNFYEGSTDGKRAQQLSILWVLQRGTRLKGPPILCLPRWKGNPVLYILWQMQLNRLLDGSPGGAELAEARSRTQSSRDCLFIAVSVVLSIKDTEELAFQYQFLMLITHRLDSMSKIDFMQMPFFIENDRCV